MDMICDTEKTFSLFDENWKKYAQIILRYSSAALQTKQLKQALEGVSEDAAGNGKKTYEKALSST